MENNKYKDPWLLLEGVVELKFESDIPPEAIFGLLYKDLIKRYENKNPLPILQIPENIRSTDPNLIFSPHYEYSNDSFNVQVGPKVLIIKNTLGAYGIKYPGWPKYMEEISFLNDLLIRNAIVKNCVRIGVRYINFFEGKDLFENNRIQLKIDTANLGQESSFLGLEIKKDDYKSRIQIINNTEILNREEIKNNGSLIDLDTYSEISFLVEKFVEKVDGAHSILEDLLFKKILTQEFIDSTKK